ncbi:hypothetical protein ACWKWC_08445 [Geodermatophilus nigrescens]|uniref:hypothetical protein n=1 Tax=Geodermatophilus sp. FMUSA9-8 TaxID=3120155 RepID=UPI00300AC77C
MRADTLRPVTADRLDRSAVDPGAARWLAPATAALAVAVGAVAVLGPLATGAITYRVTPLLEHQLEGADLVSLLLVVPSLLLAAALLLRRSPAGPLLALGSATAAWYLAAELVLGPDRTGTPGNDEAYLPLFLTVLLVSSAVALGSWWAVRPSAAALEERTRRVLGPLLLLVVAAFLLGRYLPAWWSIVSGHPSEEYLAGPQVWWTVAFEDLVLLLPAAAATGVGLLRRARWSGPAAFAVSGCLALVGAAVVAMAWSNTVHGDPGSTVGTALTMTGIGVVTVLPAVLCWAGFLRTGRRAAPPRHGGDGVVALAALGALGALGGGPAPRRADDRSGSRS